MTMVFFKKNNVDFIFNGYSPFVEEGKRRR